MKKKRALTIDDLIKFCNEHKFYEFSSKKMGYKLSVQVPASFEISEDTDDYSHQGMMKVKIKVFHTGLNRNGSYVSEEAAKKAMSSIKNRPVLAAIHQLDDGTWDFESHNIEIIENEDGESEVRYIEHQVGSFSEEEPFFEYDEENDKNFVCAYAWIPEEYTKAAEILRRKNGTKNSCELTVDELSYNAKEKYLELVSFYVEGSTFLGSRANGDEIGEGMLGSRADIVDFSTENNSVVDFNENTLIEALNNLNATLSNLNIKNVQRGGEETVSKFEELLEKYQVTENDIDFDYKDLSDDELEKKFAEKFDEDENVNDEGITGDGDGEDDIGGENEENESEVFQKIFEISHEDIRCALYQLLAPYEEANDEYYYIVGVFDDHFAYENWSGNQIWGQKYTKENDNVTFEGERYTLHRELLTDSEYTELQSMRSNYAQIEAELRAYQEKENNARKDELFKSEDYSAISDCKEFVELKNDHEALTYDELVGKLDNMLLSFVKNGKIEIPSKEGPKEKVNKKIFNHPSAKNKRSRYGNLFKK